MEPFINQEVGDFIVKAKDNDLTSRAFDHIILEKEPGGVCDNLNLGNNVLLFNDHKSKTITVRMSIIWKNDVKKKFTKYKEFELSPMTKFNVGCTEVKMGSNNKVRWNIIHTAYKD